MIILLLHIRDILVLSLKDLYNIGGHMTLSVLCLAGSARKESWNKKLAKLASTMVKDVECTYVDLADFPMPLFHEDEEADSGMPEHAHRLKKLFIEHHGFLISAPEYNSSLTPLLKNSLDWISRSESKNESPLVAYSGKVAALVSASPGALGGLRGLVPLRMMLANIGVHLIPNQLAISSAHEAFSPDGALKDQGKMQQLQGVVDLWVDTTKKIHG